MVERVRGRLGLAGRALVTVLCLVLFTGVAGAADSPRLVYANDGFWESDLLVRSTRAEELSTLRFTNCGFGPSGVNLTLQPDESAVVDDFGAWLCGDPIDVIAFEATGDPELTVYVRRSVDGLTTTSYEIPPLTWALHVGDTGEVPLIRSNAEHDTAIIAFNDGADPARLVVRVYDGDNALAGIELVDLVPGLNFHMLQTLVDVGRLELEEEHAYVSPPPADQPIYGFVAVGVRGGGSQRVIPFAPLQRIAAE